VIWGPPPFGTLAVIYNAGVPDLVRSGSRSWHVAHSGCSSTLSEPPGLAAGSNTEATDAIQR